MLRFFRQIRQRLLTENRFSKYLLYAIGEILLVVIGILIALQVNNWNEHRLENLKEIEILTELKENIIEDIKENKSTIEEERKNIRDIQSLISHLESNLPFNDTLSHYLIKPGHLERFEINSSAYETLKSLGFELVSSRELKNEVSRYYDIDTKHRKMIVDRLNNEQRGGIDQHKWKVRETYEGPPEMFKYYLATNGRFYINYLRERIGWKNNFIDDICSMNMVQAEKLVRSIDAELLKLND